MNIKHTYLLGPTCVGKGFIVNLLTRALSLPFKGNIGLHSVSIGDIVKMKLKEDPKFAAQHLQTVTRGDLLQDPIPDELFIDSYGALDLETQEDNLVLVDGYLRSIHQIEFALHKGYLTSRDSVLIMDALLDTCLKRFLHRKQTNARVDAEIETFHKRYHLHSDSAQKLGDFLRKNKCRVIDINADGDIPSTVFPEVLSHILKDVLETSRTKQRELALV